MNDDLGNRMKTYERASRTVLPRRMPVIIRVDGKAFHTLTRGCERPFDQRLIGLMNDVAKRLCFEVQGAVFGYVQSDEVSVLVHNYQRLSTEPWFDNEVQKIASVSAAIAASTFTAGWGSPAEFDARAFVIPETEVCNYFIWRQQDATRNSIQMAARAAFSHRECDRRSTRDLQEMLLAKGINWNEYPAELKRGRALIRQAVAGPNASTRFEWRVEAPPVFTANRAYVTARLTVEVESERLLPVKTG